MSGVVQIFSNVGGDDTAYFAAWGESLRREGWNVEIVSSIAGGEYRNARSRWRRVILRWKMYPGFALRIAMACLQRRQAIRIVTTNPFFAPWLAKLCSGSRARVIMLLYDLYPDALEVGGPRAGFSLAHGIMARATRAAIRHCDAMVFLGARIRRHAEAQYGAPRRGEVIPVGADCAGFGDVPPVSAAGKREIEILYCGQMGAMHDLATLAGLLAGESNPAPPERAGVHFRFYSSGRTYAELKDRYCACRQSNWKMIWEGPLSLAAWGMAMKRAEIGLVTLRPGAERVAMPSKTYSAMAAGQAILAIAPSDSDLADLVRRHNCGWVIEPGDVSGLQRTLGDIVANPAELCRKRGNAFRAAREFYDIPVVQQAWSRLLGELRLAEDA